MTDNQRKFCDEYLIDSNATRAYKVAYPHVKNDHSARTLASRLLTKVDIKKYIEAQLEKISSSKIADATEVMEYLTSVMRGTSKATTMVITKQEDGCDAIQFIEKPPDENTRLKAAKMIGERHALFRTKAEVTTTQSVTIVDDIPDE